MRNLFGRNSLRKNADVQRVEYVPISAVKRLGSDNSIRPVPSSSACQCFAGMREARRQAADRARPGTLDDQVHARKRP